jgi:hypothetical protein
MACATCVGRAVGPPTRRASRQSGPTDVMCSRWYAIVHASLLTYRGHKGRWTPRLQPDRAREFPWMTFVSLGTGKGEVAPTCCTTPGRIRLRRRTCESHERLLPALYRHLTRGEMRSIGDCSHFGVRAVGTLQKLATSASGTQIERARMSSALAAVRRSMTSDGSSSTVDPSVDTSKPLRRHFS